MADKTEQIGADNTETGSTEAMPAQDLPVEVSAVAEDLSEEMAVGVPEQEPAGKDSTPVRRGGALAVLSLLLSIGALALAGWMYYQSQNIPSQPPAAVTQAPIDPGPELRREFAGLIQKVDREAAAERQRLQDTLADLENSMQDEAQALRRANEEQFSTMQAAQNSEQQRLLAFGQVDRSDWMLAEVEYLLRLANQRLIMTADVDSTIALMSSADGILKELDDSALLPVRAAIAEDLAALRAVPGIDVEGTWLRIQALIAQVEQLVLFDLTKPPVVPAAPGGDVDWEQRLEQGFRAAAEKLSRYVVIRRRDAPYQPLLGPQWENMVRQNLRMLLEQSRAAVLSGNQRLYEQSLEDTRRWLNEFFSLKESGVSALDAELQSLSQLTVSREYPDVSRPLQRLESVINTRHMVSEDN
jgi:uroporphyrin-3 C-methyltransferase